MSESPGNTPNLFGPEFESARARQEWADACVFHDLSEAEVLKEVSRRALQLKAKAPSLANHPLVLLDLDSTLYEVGPRTLQIMNEWSQSAEAQAFPQIVSAMGRLELRHLGYSLKDTWSALGLSFSEPETKKALDGAKKFWNERFFSSAYLKYDRPYQGAADFVREIYATGAEIVYLTGRDEPGMGEGTRQNLIRDEFPWDVARTHLLMKRSPEIPDVRHKQEAASYLRQHGALIASFENEPLNLIALYEIFPAAMHVFVDTVCSDRPALPRRGLYRIKGFSN